MILAFCRGKGFISAAIRWQTWSRYAHVAAVLPDRSVVEAWPGRGVRCRKFWLDTTGIDFYQFHVPAPSAYFAFLTHCCYSKAKYDYLGVLRFLPRWKADTANQSYFCSELIFQAADAGGAELLSRIAATKVTPGLLSCSPKLTPISLRAVHALL